MRSLLTTVGFFALTAFFMLSYYDERVTGVGATGARSRQTYLALSYRF